VSLKVPQALNEEKVACFLKQVRDGDIDEVRAALQATPALVNAIGPHPYWGGRPQPLHMAIEGNQRAIFDLLLDAGADVNGDNAGYDHWSPLMLTFDERPEMRKVLLDRGAKTGLVEAMLMKDDALVGRLLAAGKSALPKDGPNRGSMLAFARTTFAIDRLIDLGAPTEIKDRWGASPVEAMSRLGQRGRPLVRHMASRGLKVAPEEYARMGDREALETLVAASPEVAKADAVMMGAVDFQHHDLVRYLLSKGGNANARAVAQSRHTALHSAAWNGDLEMAKLLLDAGADINARDAEHDGTPRGWAEVSIRISGNAKCKAVEDFLAANGGLP
jgi:ankyrin repeat protein